MPTNKYRQGIFRPLNPNKYRGNVKNICYRSSYELRCMTFFDKHPEIIEWSSEEYRIGYRHPFSGKMHRYFPDFWYKRIENGHAVETLVEIKPYSQTIPPKLSVHKKTGKPNLSYMRAMQTYAINQAKWEAARNFCLKHGWKWIIVTEKNLPV